MVTKTGYNTPQHLITTPIFFAQQHPQQSTALKHHLITQLVMSMHQLQPNESHPNNASLYSHQKTGGEVKEEEMAHGGMRPQIPRSEKISCARILIQPSDCLIQTFRSFKALTGRSVLCVCGTQVPDRSPLPPFTFVRHCNFALVIFCSTLNPKVILPAYTKWYVFTGGFFFFLR